jgi:hypothetical protein
MIYIKETKNLITLKHMYLSLLAPLWEVQACMDLWRG